MIYIIKEKVNEYNGLYFYQKFYNEKIEKTITFTSGVSNENLSIQNEFLI